ncbi:MAG: integrase arm-type DNA-binding domain-containing protein [Pseudomonadales bacterium]|nr:integrase arm-type DNA-binding domain-containing protein [Pseudomonadales bacterium]
MALSDLKVKTAKPTEKNYKLADEKGLHLLVKSAGGKYWRFKYRINGKEKLMALGVYPDTSLALARSKRDEARALLANGIDPMDNKHAVKAAHEAAITNSFEIVANEWLKKRGQKSEGNDQRLHKLLHKDLFPWLGNRPIDQITPKELLETLRRIEERGAIETAQRAKQYAGLIYRYAVATGRVERDISADLRGALKTTKTKHFASITNPKEVAKLLIAIDQYTGTPVVHAALKLSPLLFCRPGELRNLEWSEVNWAEGYIEIPAHKMKMGQPHIIPLCRQAIEILRDLQPITARSIYVFPSARGASRPLSENGVRTALRNIGYTNEEMTPHGFRAMARTILDEVLEVPVEWIEQQLAHSVKDANGRAYNRTKHLKQRREMMQRWGDYLDELKVFAS